MLVRITLIASLLLLCACQHSPRKEYFALNAALPPATTESATNTPARPVQVIGIGPISIPEYLEHMRISYWKTPHQLSLQENDYWVEPLEQGVSRVLALQLQATHPQWRVVQFPWRNSQRPTYAIRVDIQRLDAYSDYAMIDAGLDLIDMQSNNIIRSTQFSTRITYAETNAKNTTGNSAAIAQAFSELLQKTAVSMESLLLSTVK